MKMIDDDADDAYDGNDDGKDDIDEGEKDDEEHENNDKKYKRYLIVISVDIRRSQYSSL